MVVILVEPAGALLQRSLELRGNTLEPYSCEVLASYSAAKLKELNCAVEVFCCNDEDQTSSLKAVGEQKSEYEHEVIIHVLQHGRKAVEDQELASTILALLRKGSAPYVVGLSVRTYAYMKSLALAAILKSRNDDIKIVLGGYHPSVSCGDETKERRWEKANRPDFLRPVDFRVIGEGEKPFAALLGKLLNIENDKICSALTLNAKACKALLATTIAKRNATSLPAIIGGAEWRLSLAEFASAPWPVRNPHLMWNWCRNWNLSYPSPSKQTGVFQLQFTRGCSHSACKFCCTPYVFGWKNDVRYKTPSGLVNEILAVRSESITAGLPAPNFAYFNDVTFNTSNGEWRKLCKSLILERVHTPHPAKGDSAEFFPDNCSESILDAWLTETAKRFKDKPDLTLDIPVNEDIDTNLHWFALCRGDAVSNEDALLLASAGCSKVGIGIESFSNDVAGPKGLGKQNFDMGGSYVDSIKTSLMSTDQVGIINRVYIILGSPTETIDSLRATWDMLKTLPIDQIRVAFYVPYVTDDPLLATVEQTVLNEDKPNIIVPMLTPALSKLAKEMAVLPSEDSVSHKTDEDPFILAIKASSGVSDLELAPEFLKAFRSNLIRGFYESNFYKSRVELKLARYPHLEESYREFFVELYETSAGGIDIRSCLTKREGQ